MDIHGLNKTTLLDYPGQVAACIFTGGCNLRCPFCQNGGLVAHPQEEPVISEDEFFAFLRKRADVLTGVCISGGEPTLQPDLRPFLMRIRELGYHIKLDSNGYRPDILIPLIEDGLVDYVAMDIKSSPARYAAVSGVDHMDLSRIQQSVYYLMQNHIPYEFRTTVVRELHSPEDFVQIGEWLAGCSAYYLQSYRDSENVLVPGYTACTTGELREYLEILKPTIPNAALRGID